MTEFEKALENFSKTKDIGEWGALVEKEGIRLYDEIAKEFKDWKAPKPLPAIPQFVADEIEREKRNENDFENIFLMLETNEKFDDWFTTEKNETLMRAWLDGYTIEVEKKYYLKNKITKCYLHKLNNSSKKFCEFLFTDGAETYTQEEIDNMDNIGSYKKIEVGK